MNEAIHEPALALRTEVAILGAGPAGLMLGQLLARRGVAAVVVEVRSREHVEQRIRAGVLEQGTVDALEEVGAAARLRQHALVHDGVIVRWPGGELRIELRALTGKAVTVWGQHELARDLIAGRLADGAPLYFDCEDVALHGLPDEPRLTFRHRGQRVEVRCQLVAGCDGSHGLSRAAIPPHLARSYEQVWPYGWLGILAEVAPASPELVYAHHPRGFSLLSMRSPAVSRLYLQCAPDEDLAAWPDARIWDELACRLAAPGFRLTRGPIVQRSVTTMRSLVVEPMRYGALFLAGDSAHIMPPTGAKGLNLAVADARLLADAFTAALRDGDRAALDAYSARCLRRVWKVLRFSSWMTHLLHRPPDASSPASSSGDLAERLQLAELDTLATSRAAQTAFAEAYVGLPLLSPEPVP